VLAEALVASVCHSTNWDRLRHHVLRYFEEVRPTAQALARLSEHDFARQFSDGFSSLEIADQPALDLTTRYRIFHEVAERYAYDRFGLNGESRHLLSGNDGLIPRLRNVAGFDLDPEGKKLRVFVQNLIRYKLAAFDDSDSLAPAIEYHILRLYIRTGRVVPNTDSAVRSVESNNVRRIDSVSALRQAVAEAMRITADAADLSLIEINDIEWQIARSLCVREEPRCDGPPLPEKPLPSHLSDDHERCLLRSVCAAFLGQVPKHWTEPNLAPKYATIY